MTTRGWGLVLAAVAGLAASGAVGRAEARGRRAPPMQGFFAPEAYAPYARDARRGQNPYTVPRGYQEAITATTPNESGNLGGPSTGGGGGR